MHDPLGRAEGLATIEAPPAQDCAGSQKRLFHGHAPRKPHSGHDVRRARRISGSGMAMLRQPQAGGAVVFIGDSISERAKLPASICGHAVVNAGISGSYARQYADFVRAAGRLYPAERPAMVVIAIGVNDAHRDLAGGDFATDYARLVDTMARTGARIVLATPTPLQEGPAAEPYDPERWSAIRDAIGSLAKMRGLPLADLSDVRGSVDGVHLSPAGYSAWMPAIVGTAEASLCR